MNKTNTCLAVLACSLGCFLGGSLPAQTPLAAEDAKPIGLQMSVQFSGTAGSRFKARGTEFRDVDIGAAAFGLSQTFGLSDQMNLQVGFEHAVYFVDTRKNHVVPLPKRLQSLGIPVTVNYAPGNDWTWTFAATPGLSFAGTTPRTDGFGFSGIALASRRAGPGLSYSLGVGYDSLSSDYKVFPVVGVEWKPADRWSIALGIPRTGVSFQLNERIAMALELSGNAGTFHVKDDPLPGRSDKPDLKDSKLEYAEARIGFSTTFQVNRHVTLGASAGHVLLSELKYLKRDYKLKSDNVTPFVAVTGAFSF